MLDAIVFRAAQLFSLIHEFVHVRFGRNVWGLGFTLRMLRRDRILKVKGHSLYFSSSVADCYDRLINGRYNEPETHTFIHRVIDLNLGWPFQFIEVGANVGEFIIDLGSSDRISKIVAFEPQPACVLALEKTCLLNDFSKVRIIQKAVNDVVGRVNLERRSKGHSGAGILAAGVDGFEVDSTTIDSEALDTKLPTIFLIDAEGAELRIMSGGREYIRENSPLIIFEYNHVSRRFFTTEQVERELGTAYSLYRLRPDGGLDFAFQDTWNLVAVSQNGPFAKAWTHILSTLEM